MRVIFFYQYFGTPKGKWSTRVYELTRRWVDQGVSVTVVTAPYDKSDLTCSGFIDRQQINGIDLIVINAGDSNRFSILKRIYRFCLFSLLSVWFALTRSYDVAVASSGPITIGIPVILAKWLRRKPYIFEVRDLWPQGAIEMGLLKGKRMQKLSLWFEGLCYSNASIVVGCSKGMVDSINRRFPNVETSIIPNASDIELFGRENQVEGLDLDGVKHFVYAGSLGAMDDVLSVVRAAKVLMLRGVTDVQIVIIGDGAERNMLEAYVRDKGLSNVSFLGLLPKNEVVAWFHKAWASFVCFKPFDVLNTVSPNKMFDSFAAGVPIIQNTTGWIAELVVEVNCGINVEPGNDSAMADAILLCASNPDVQRQMSKNALSIAQERFCRNKMALDYVGLLQKVGGRN